MKKIALGALCAAATVGCLGLAVSVRLVGIGLDSYYSIRGKRKDA